MSRQRPRTRGAGRGPGAARRAALGLLALLVLAAANPAPLQAAERFPVTALGPQAVFSCQALAVNGTTSSTGGSSSTLGHVVSGDAITVNSSGRVNGDAIPGPGKTVTVNSGGTVTGSKTPAKEAPACTPVDLAALATVLSTANDNGRIGTTKQGKTALSGTAFTLASGDEITLAAGTYSFSSLTLNSGSSLKTAGLVRILVNGSSLNLSSAANAGTGRNPSDLRLFTTATTVNVNSGASLTGYLYAPSATLIVNSGASVVGGVFGKRVTLNSGASVARWLGLVDTGPPAVVFTSPADGANASGVDLTALDVRGTVTDPDGLSGVTVTVNGVAATVDGTGTFRVTLDVSALAPLRLTAVATDPSGNTATATRTLCGRPQVELTAPLPGSTVTARTVDLVLSCGDTASPCQSVTVNGIAATLSGGSYRVAGYDLGVATGLKLLSIRAVGPCGTTTLTRTLLLGTAADSFALMPWLLGQAVFSREAFVLDNNARTGSTGATGAPTGQGHVVSNGTIGVSNNAVLDGDATAGAGASIPVPAPQNNGTITGAKAKQTSDQNPVPLDLGPVATALAATNSNATLPRTDKNRDPLEGTGHTELRLDNNDGLTIPPGTYYFTKITVGNNAVLRLGGSVRILCTGAVVFDNNSKANDGGLPVDLRIWVSGTSDGKVDNGAVLKAFVYAPLALLAVDNNAVVTGGLFARKVTVKNGARVNRWLDQRGPTLTLAEPADGATPPDLAHVTVRGTAVDPDGGPVAVWVVAGATSVPAAVGAGGAFQTTVDLRGVTPAVVSVVAIDAAGRTEVRAVTLSTSTCTQPPALALTSPTSLLLRVPVVDLAGTCGGATAVTVNGVAAQVLNGIFTFTGLSLGPGDGLRNVVIQATAPGCPAASKTVTFEVDSTPPTVTVDTPPAPASGCRTPEAATVLSGRYADLHPAATGAVTVEIHPAGDTASMPVIVVPTVDLAQGRWTVSGAALGTHDGTATIVVTARDALGNTSRASAAWRIDATTPTITLLLDGAPFPGSGTGTAPPAGAVPALLARAVSAQALVADGTAAAPPAPTFTLDGAAYAAGTPITVDGLHTLVARATDCAGHEAAAWALFRIDRTAPQLLSLTPANGATLTTAVSSVSGTADSELSAARVNDQAARLGTPPTTFTLAPFASREGLNTLRVVLVDLAGNESAFDRSFTVRTTGPTLEILESGALLALGTTFFRAVTPVIRCSDPSATITATLDGQPFTSGTLVSSAGSHAITATAVDSAGNQASASATFRIDLSTPPTIDITAPADGAILPGPKIAVTGTCSASTTSVTVNGRSAGQTGTTWSLPDLDLAPDLPAEIVAVARDAAGRTATATRTVTVRSSGPRLLVSEPADGASTNRRKVDVAGAVVGGKASIAGGKVTVTPAQGAPMDGALDALGQFRVLDVPLAPGANTITVSATDLQGRPGTAQLTVTSDQRAPVVTFRVGAQPLADGVRFGGPVTIHVEVTDDGPAVPAPLVRLNGQDVHAAAAAVDVPITQTGGYVLSVVARDAAGNETRDQRSFLLDTTACTFADVDPADGFTTSAARVSIRGRSGTASSVAVRVPGASPASYTDYPALLADGTFAIADVPLPATGANALALVCTDASGAPHTQPLIIQRLAGAGPAVALTSPSTGARVSTATLAVTGTVSDPAARVTVNGAAAQVTNGTFSATVSLAEGPNVVSARAVDAVGREGESRAVVLRDSKAPSIQITSPMASQRIGRAGSDPLRVTVTGLVDLGEEPGLASVTVQGPLGTVTATVDPATGRFVAPDVLLSDTTTAPQTLTATATDLLGQRGTATVAVVADPTGPALVLGAPPDATRTSGAAGSSLAVSGEAWGPEGTQVSVNATLLDPGTLAWDAAAADGRRHTAFSTSVPVPSAEGPFTVVVRVDTLAGASATVRRLLVVDRTPPAVARNAQTGVLEMVPGDGATGVDPDAVLLVLFTEAIDPTTLPDGLTLSRAGTGERVAATATPSGSAVALVPGAALVRGQSYKLRAGTTLTDLTGQPLAAAQEVTFTVAVDPLATAPVLDSLPALLCATSLHVKGTTVPGVSVRVRDGAVALTGRADTQGRFDVVLPLAGNGYHQLHVANLSASGSEQGAEATALLRVDCSAPSVAAAAFDRTLGRLVVTFSEAMAPASLAVGGASDALRLSLVEDASRAAQPATLTLDASATTATLQLPTDALAWWRDKAIRLEVRAPATDARGNAVAPYETTFFPSGELSGGFVAGEAYDDESGRPLSGVSVGLYPSGGLLPGAAPAASLPAPLMVQTTDARGRFTMAGDLTAGRYALVFGKDGHTCAVRRLPLEPSSGAVPFDARLTPLSAAWADPLAVATGGRFTASSGWMGPTSASSVVLDVAPNALTATPPSLVVRLTPLSGQGLPELLPLGYTPLAAVNLRLEASGTALPEGSATPFVPNAVHVTVPLPPGLLATASLLAARYDVVSGTWLTLDAPVRSMGADGVETARIALLGPGTIAVVTPDTDAAIAPPALSGRAGETLAGSAAPAASPALTGSLRLDPPLVTPTGRSTARVIARSVSSAPTPDQPWPSGLPVQAFLDEKLLLADGGALYEAPFTTDLVVYHSPLTADELGSSPLSAAGATVFRVSPSPAASEHLLETGYENIRLYPFPETLERGEVLGTAGGTVTSTDGTELRLAEGALSARTVVKTRLLTAQELSAYAAPAGYDLVAGVRIDLGGTGVLLARPATLRLPLPTGVTPDVPSDPRLIAAELVSQPADGRGAFCRLLGRTSRVAAAGALPERIETAPEPAASPLPLDGIVRDGIVLVLRAKNPIGFATGFVLAANGTGLAQARAGSAGLGTADLSQPGGRYALPVLAGPTPVVSALHPQLDEAGSASASALAPNGVARIDVTIRPQGPTLVSVQPADGSTNQPILSPVRVQLSEALDPTSIGSGTLRVELASADGTPTGVTFLGTVALSPDRTAVVFTAQQALPPGRRLLCTYNGGVRDAGGTPYSGAVPVTWTFTTSADVFFGGQIDPSKIRILLPANGTAQVIGADGALPRSTPDKPWAVFADIEGPVVCGTRPTASTYTSNFNLTVGCPPTVPVTYSSRIWLKVLDPQGNITSFRLGPFVTEDGKGFVAQPAEETTYTTPDGIAVTVPAAAFDTPRLVTIRTLDRATLGVAMPPDLEVGAYIDVDFEGTARETLRVKVPVTTSANVGTLVFAGAPIDLPWGRKLRILDLGRIVDGGSGSKLISNLEADQPSASVLAASSSVSALGMAPLSLPPRFLRLLLAEVTARTAAAFFFGVNVQLAALVGRSSPTDVEAARTAFSNDLASAFVFVPRASDWDGHYLLPVVVGSAPSVVLRDTATGWVLGKTTYDPVSSGGNGFADAGDLPPPASSLPPHPPRLVDGTPLEVVTFHAYPTATERRCERLRLELEACTESGLVDVHAVPGFPLPPGSTVSLHATRRDEQGRESGESVRTTVTDGGGLAQLLRLSAVPADELLVVVGRGDYASESLARFTLTFDQVLEEVPQGLLDCAPASTDCLVTLWDLGEKGAAASASQRIALAIEQSADRRQVRISPQGVMPQGHSFSLVLKGGALFVRNLPRLSPPTLAYPAHAPALFGFATRPPADREVGSVGPGPGGLALGDTNLVRDFVKVGNLLVAGSATGRILAFDTSDITRQKTASPLPFARAVTAAQDVRALATDGHGRVFWNVLEGSSWAVGGAAIEDVRRASLAACPSGPPPSWAAGVPCFRPFVGGVRSAFALGSASDLTVSEYLTQVGSLPVGTPMDLEVLVWDETNPPNPSRPTAGTDAPAELDVRAFYARYGSRDAFPSAEADGTYVLDLTLATTHTRRPDSSYRDGSLVCPGEKPWDHFQRVTVENLTTGQSFSFDIHDAWDPHDTSGEPVTSDPPGTLTIGREGGVRVRAGDRMRVRFNVRALGYVAIVGGGIEVVDLNRFYRTPSPGATTQGNKGQCGRLIAREAGASLTLPGCPSDRDPLPAGTGIDLTPALAVLPHGANGAAVYSPLTRFGAIRSSHVLDGSAGPALGVEEMACLRPPSSAPFPGTGVTFRDVAVARSVTWSDRHYRYDAQWRFLRPAGAPAAAVPVTSDLALFTGGEAGLFALALQDEGLGFPPALIGRFYRKGHLVSRVAVDPSGRYAFAGGFTTATPPEPFIDVWDLGRANGAPDPDAPDAADARLLVSLKVPWDANHVFFDETGTGLLYTWGSDGTGGRALPVSDPSFVFAGLYRPAQEPPAGQAAVPEAKVTARFAPLGVPMRVTSIDEVDPAKRKEVDRLVTAAFKVRVALPGDLGDAGQLLAKVQSLRALPEGRLLAQEDAGPTLALPGGPGWPSNEVFVTLERLGRGYATDASDRTGGSGRLSPLFNEYESREVVVLVADPRARRAYSPQRITATGLEETDEESQCRRCTRPEHVQALVDSGRLAEGDVKELLAGGPYLRVLLSTTPLDPTVELPAAARTATDRTLAFFAGLNATADGYRAPSGTASVLAWADEVPSPVQTSLAEPARGAAALPLEAGASVLLRSGEAVLTTADHAVRGRGLGFAAERTYRSGLLGYGPLGASGFTSPLLAHLREVPRLVKPAAGGQPEEVLYPGEVQYHDGEGRVFRFYPPCEKAPCPAGYVEPPAPQDVDDPPRASRQCPQGYEADDQGSYCVPAGLSLRLERQVSSWRLLSAGHDSAEFDEHGRLAVLSDRHRKGAKDPDTQGNSLKLLYDPFGQLGTVEDDYGRAYRLAYRTDPRPAGDGKRYGLLSRLDDFASRSVEYEFQPDDRTLRKVRLPEVANPAYGLSYTGASRPTIEYVYAAAPLSPSAPLHGAELSRLLVTGLKLPQEPGRLDAPERISFTYDQATGRLATLSVPPSTAGRPRPTLTFAPPDAGVPSVKLTHPWGHEVTYGLENGRLVTVSESLETLRENDPTPSAQTGAPPPLVPTTTTYAYTADGRVRTVTRPDGSQTVTEYDSKNADRLARGNPLKVRELPGPARAQGARPGALATYSETVTAFSYRDALLPDLHMDNQAVLVTDGLGRVSRPQVAETSAVAVPSGHDAAPSQPQALRAQSDFDPFGRLKRYEGGPGLPNPSKVALTFGKDAKGKAGAGFLQEIAHGEVKETAEYDGGDSRVLRGNVTKRTTSFGTYTTVVYDEWDRPIAQTGGLSTSADFTPVSGATSRRAFDAAGHLVSEIRRQDPLGDVETRTEYNDREQVVRVTTTRRAPTEPGAALVDDVSTTQTYDDFGRLARTTSPQGIATSRTYDQAGRLSAEQTGSSGPRRRLYDLNGRVVVATDGDQGSWRGRYDGWGRLWSEEHPAGAVVERQFDQAGGLVEEATYDRKDPNTRKLLAQTNTNVTSYGSVNEITELLTSLPRSTRLTRKGHDEAGRLVKVTSGPTDTIQRTELEVTYDQTSRPLEIRDAAGNRTAHVYTAAAPWPTETARYETVPGLAAPVLTTRTRILERDALGRVLRLDRGDGTLHETTYDQPGNVLSAQAGLGNLTRTSYDGAGKPLVVNRPAGRGATRFGYDRDGRLVVRVSEGASSRADRTSFNYDVANGRLASIGRPDGTSESYTYNLDDTVDTWTRRSGVQVKHLYDPANRLLARQIAKTGGAGAPLTDGGDTYTWDALSRLLTVGRPSSSAQGVAFQGYDTAGRPAMEVVGTRDPLTRQWDTWSREASVALPAGIGRHPNGSFTGYARSFDLLDRVVGIDGGASLGATWTWGGKDRPYGSVSRGPLHTAQRYSYLASGLGPQPGGDVATPWRLGVVSYGAAESLTAETDAPSALWGQLGFGYRAGSGAKVGRQVLASAPLLTGQGWRFGLDNALRLTTAAAGQGGDDTPSETFTAVYGAGDEVLTTTRSSGEAASYTTGAEGRITSRDGVPFTYDAEGHRTSDDRFVYTWGWRDELLAVTVKDCWPDATGRPSTACPAGFATPSLAGHQVRLVRDTLGRLFAEEHRGPQATAGDDASRPFVERKEFLWDGDTLLAEVGSSADGALVWRKSYVPGPAGVDDPVQLRVERYDASGNVTSDQLYAYLADEQHSILSLVDETSAADPAKPRVVVRYLYDPYGRAHAETGPELRSARLEPDQNSLRLPDGTLVSQTFDPATAVPGRFRLVLSVPADPSTLASGVVVEKRLTDGTWGALTAADLALSRDAATQDVLLLPRTGWQRGTSYRIRLAAALRDALGRAPADLPSLDLPVPSDGTSPTLDVAFPVSYDTALAASETVGGTIPGGQSILWQGAWTSSVSGLQYKRARVYDPRTSAFLTEDPADDVDSPNLYGYVAGRPHEATDPLGLQEIQPGTPEADAFSLWADRNAKLDRAREAARRIGAVGASALDIATDLAPGIGAAKIPLLFMEAYEKGGRSELRRLGLSVATVSAVAAVMGRRARLPGAKVDEATAALERKAEAALALEKRELERKAAEAITFKLKRPPGVTDAQWQQKMDALNRAAAEGRARVVHEPMRTGAAQEEARRAGLVKSGDDADHGLDLQFGGDDAVKEIISTNPRVNRSVGAQGKKRLQYPDGTPIKGFEEQR